MAAAAGEVSYRLSVISTSMPNITKSTDVCLNSFNPFFSFAPKKFNCERLTVNGNLNIQELFSTTAMTSKAALRPCYVEICCSFLG